MNGTQPTPDEEGHAQPWIQLEHPVEHHAAELASLGEQVLHRVRRDEAGHAIEAELSRRSPVERHRDVQALRFLPERMEGVVAVWAPVGGQRRKYRPDHA